MPVGPFFSPLSHSDTYRAQAKRNERPQKVSLSPSFWKNKPITHDPITKKNGRNALSLIWKSSWDLQKQEDLPQGLCGRQWRSTGCTVSSVNPHLKENNELRNQTFVQLPKRRIAIFHDACATYSGGSARNWPRDGGCSSCPASSGRPPPTAPKCTAPRCRHWACLVAASPPYSASPCSNCKIKKKKIVKTKRTGFDTKRTTYPPIRWP